MNSSRPIKSLASLANFFSGIPQDHPTLGTSGKYANPSMVRQVIGYIPKGLHPSRRDDCLTAFVFLLNFMEAPLGVPRIEELRRPLQFLLSRFCQAMRLSSSDTRTLIALSRLLIKAILQQRPITSPSRSSSRLTPRLTRKHDALYSFLLNCSMKSSFPYFGSICHNAFLTAPSEPPHIPRSRKYDLALHLETFLDCVPLPPVASDRFVPDGRTDYVDAAVYVFQLVGKNGSCPSEETVKNYARTWRQVISRAPLIPVDPRHSLLSTLVADDEQPCTDLPPPSEQRFNDDDEESPDGHRFFIHSYGPASQSAMQEAEAPEEHSRRSLSAPEKDLPIQDLFTWMRRQALARAARINSSIAYWWDRSCPTLTTDLDLWCLARTGRAEAALAWLIKHTGLAPQTALDIKLLLDDQIPPDEAMFLDARNQTLRYMRPLGWCGFNSDRYLISTDGCEESSRDITIPLPPLVWQGLEPYLQHRLAHGRLLAGTALHDRLFITDTEPCQPLTLTKVNRFLRRAISSPTAITLHSLSRAFKLLYGGRFGLDEILACYISGRVPYFLRAPMFYTRVRLANLTSRYWDASLRYAEALVLELQTCAQPQDDAITTLCMLINTNRQPADDILSSATAFGSKAVPRFETVLTFFQDYRNLLAGLAQKPLLDDHRLYFNHFMIYSFLAFGYATAIRPVSDATIRDRHFRKLADSTGSVLIADKANQRYADSRFIPLSSVAYQIITRVIEARKSFIEYLDRQGMLRYADLAQVDWPILFLFKPDFRITLLRPKTIRQHLEEIDLGDRYRVPLNANRHFFRSHLRPLLPAHLIHAILGHQHQGREWMGRVSVSDLEKARDLLTSEIDRMLHFLEIVPMTFECPQ